MRQASISRVSRKLDVSNSLRLGLKNAAATKNAMLQKYFYLTLLLSIWYLKRIFDDEECERLSRCRHLAIRLHIPRRCLPKRSKQKAEGNQKRDDLMVKVVFHLKAIARVIGFQSK